jgi:hypothetical protein
LTAVIAMKWETKYGRWVCGALAVVVVVAGCSSTRPASDPAASPPKMMNADADAPESPSGKGRAQLWSENCNRCHNYRPAESYGDRDWQIVMMHMRLRGYLTGEEQRAILEFLQGSN